MYYNHIDIGMRIVLRAQAQGACGNDINRAQFHTIALAADFSSHSMRNTAPYTAECAWFAADQ